MPSVTEGVTHRSEKEFCSAIKNYNHGKAAQINSKVIIQPQRNIITTGLMHYRYVYEVKNTGH